MAADCPIELTTKGKIQRYEEPLIQIYKGRLNHWYKNKKIWPFTVITELTILAPLQRYLIKFNIAPHLSSLYYVQELRRKNDFKCRLHKLLIVKNCKNAPLYHFVGPGAVASWREKWGKHAKVTKSAIRLQKVKRLERLKAKGLFFVARIWT